MKRVLATCVQTRLSFTTTVFTHYPLLELSDPSPTKMSRSRAVWNTECDRKLIDFLFDQRLDGMQTSNGNWHKSAWTAAEPKLSGTEAQSGGGPKTTDSCKNRWGALKKEYREVKIIRDKSGFGWNVEKSLATAEDSVWEKLFEAHPQFRKWQTTPFPLYDDMADLVEGTYATGKGVVRPGQDQTPSIDSNSDSDYEKFAIDPAILQMSVGAPTSSISVTPLTPAPASSKRQAADTLEPVSGKRTRQGRKKSGSQAIGDMASSIDRLASTFAVDAAVPSPMRKRAAIHAIEDDGDLSDNEQTQAFQIIRKDTAFADTILAIRKKDARTRLIKSELYPLQETSGF